MQGMGIYSVFSLIAYLKLKSKNTVILSRTKEDLCWKFMLVCSPSGNITEQLTVQFYGEESKKNETKDKVLSFLPSIQVYTRCKFSTWQNPSRA